MEVLYSYRVDKHDKANTFIDCGGVLSLAAFQLVVNADALGI